MVDGGDGAAPNEQQQHCKNCHQRRRRLCSDRGSYSRTWKGSAEGALHNNSLGGTKSCFLLPSVVDQRTVLKMPSLFVLVVLTAVLQISTARGIPLNRNSGSAKLFLSSDAAVGSLVASAERFGLAETSKLKLESPVGSRPPFAVSKGGRAVVTTRSIASLTGHEPLRLKLSAITFDPQNDALTEERLTPLVVQVVPKDEHLLQLRSGDVPTFTKPYYQKIIHSDQTVLGTVLFRLRKRTAFATGRNVFYYLVKSNENADRQQQLDRFFDIDGFSGEIYTIAPFVAVGNYTLVVKVSYADSAHVTSETVLSIIVLAGRNGITGRKKGPSRLRRQIGRNPIVMHAAENRPPGYLGEIPLNSDERVKNAPVVGRYLTIYRNGSVELNNDLDYEGVDGTEVQATVVIENPPLKSETVQRVRVVVSDVQEPPVFTNGFSEPTYETVVPLQNGLSDYSVFRFTASNERGISDAATIEYQLTKQEPEAMFRVDSKSGDVRTVEGKVYVFNATYNVLVQAKDKLTGLTSNVVTLNIRGGKRPPQFAQAQYFATVPENTAVDATVAHVKAKTFLTGTKYGPITYRLTDIENDRPDSTSSRDPLPFAVDSKTGVVTVRRPFDYDAPTEPRRYTMNVWASEGDPTIDARSVPLVIAVGDENDNAPLFSQPLYAKTVKESWPIGEPILTVSALDKDAGGNAEIVYEVDNHNFTVNARGELSPRVRLDADQNRVGYFIYVFNVTAIDQGRPPRRSVSTIRIRTENTNDEAPSFVPTARYTEFVAEDAGPGTPVVTIVALDPDKDQVTYAFKSPNGRPVHDLNIFTIDPDTGLIKLAPHVTPAHLSQNRFNLTVIATDDGSCCKDGSSKHSSEAEVIIGVSDVNNNKPVFRNCAGYSQISRIKEGRHNGSEVIVKVLAEDDDSGLNGQVLYSLYYPKGQSRKPFVIDPSTGELRPHRNVEFDRETRQFEDVTVKARDKGKRPLIGFCQFKVAVEDVNDNSPQFHRSTYEISLARNTPIGTSVVVVFADDIDSPENARITYSIKPDYTVQTDDDISYFELPNSNSGNIQLVQKLPPGRENYQFLVVANDNGVPESRSTEATVTIRVRSNQQSTPVWQQTAECPRSKVVDERINDGTTIFKCLAISGNGHRIQYSMANGAKKATNSHGDFREYDERIDGQDWVLVKTDKVLDYERTANYTLTLTATDLTSQVSMDMTLYLSLRDQNDEVPRFSVDHYIGQVVEEQPPSRSKPVARVQATDGDTVAAFKRVRYELLNGEMSKLFRVDEESGDIYALATFDRELNDSFILDVRAYDGALSALPHSSKANSDTTKVTINVEDINDNPPYFNHTQYNGSVSEIKSIGQAVMTVKADDKDSGSNLRYSLVNADDGERSPFGVRTDGGTVFVKERIDYETKKSYDLIYEVSDGKFSQQTKLHIKVLDYNDNEPVLTPKSTTLDLLEYDSRKGRPQNFRPQVLVRFNATDVDEDEKSKKIVFRVDGQGVNNDKYFAIDETTGALSVVRPLDRDPGTGGAPEYQLIVSAIDDGGNGLAGYADVTIRVGDVNDNMPVFEKGTFIGEIKEHTDPGANGAFVTMVTAVDYDQPGTLNSQITYSIVKNKHEHGADYFRIEPHSGKIFALRQFDRENPSERELTIVVRADDNGKDQQRQKAANTARVTIRVLDINDNDPVFKPNTYNASVPETTPVGHAVLQVSAFDKDDDAEDNILSYSLTTDNDYFYITTDPDASSSNVGIIRVKKPLDYEDEEQRRGFNLEVRVTDGDSSHFDLARVRIRLEDRNDNPPRILPPPGGRLRVSEDTSVGTVLHRFEADDPDNDGNDTQTAIYTLYGKTRGLVVRWRINRVSDPLRQFSITSGGVLSLVKPLDREVQAEYNLAVEAVDTAGNMGTAKVLVMVGDVNDNAPRLRPNPCRVQENLPKGTRVCVVHGEDPDDSAVGNGPPFKFEILNTGDNNFDLLDVAVSSAGNGSITVTTKEMLDREGEYGKVLRLPFRVTDTGKQSAVRVLMVEIGDMNDNDMSDGSSRIDVFSYMGRLPSTDIGRVYVTDMDDWDLESKSFALRDGKGYFSVDQNTGTIRMNPGLDVNTDHVIETDVTQTLPTQNLKALGTTSVRIEEVPEQAFKNAGSIRILADQGQTLDPQKAINAEDFIRLGKDGSSSPYQRFRTLLASKLGMPEENVQVFALMENQVNIDDRPGGKTKVLDIWFAAHNSPYQPTLRMNGVVQGNREEFEKTVGINILQVNVDECLTAACDSCHTVATASPKPVIISANQTGFVGVNVTTRAVCGCLAPSIPTTCGRNTCAEGSVCHKPSSGGFFCECRDAWRRGPRCEGRVRNFDGKGYAWVKPIEPCTHANFSFEFRTTSANGILLYNGPMAKVETGDIHPDDMVVIRLENGKPYATINTGFGSTHLYLDNAPMVSDNKWHRIDFWFESRKYELVLDRCTNADLPNPLNGQTTVDVSQCWATGNVQRDEERLNIRDPMQIGGLAPADGFDYASRIGAATPGLDGCIRNLHVGGELVDLGNVGWSEGSQASCLRGGCDSNAIDGVPPCVYGECSPEGADDQFRCICDPGFSGLTCNQPVTWYQFAGNGFINYELPNDKFSSVNTDVQLVFAVERDTASSVLAAAHQKDGRNMAVVKLTQGKPVGSFALDTDVELDQVRVSGADPHLLHFSRTPYKSSIRLDGLAGPRYYSEIKRDNRSGNVGSFFYDKNGVFLGTENSGISGFAGCVADFRFANLQMPLGSHTDGVVAQPGQNAVIKNIRNVQEGCDLIVTCADTNAPVCGDGTTCIDFAKGAFCTCPYGAQVEVLDIDGSLVSCGPISLQSRLSISKSAVATILLCLLVLIILVLILVVYTRRRQPMWAQIGPNDEVRENIINYGVEGGGEEDQDTYNIGPLRKPVLPIEDDNYGQQRLPPAENGGVKQPPLPPPSDTSDFIADRVKAANRDPNSAPFDELRVYDDEGGGMSPAPSLSSLESGAESMADWDEALNDWGPRFNNIKDIYS